MGTSATQAEAQLVERLKRNRLENDDQTDRSSELTGILAHTVHDRNPLYSLQDVANALLITDASCGLDALQVVPLILASKDPATDLILSLLTQHGNAKEAVLAAQESFEKLRHDEGVGGGEGSLQIVRLLRIYIGAIPRLQHRKRRTSETLSVLFAAIVPVVGSLGPSLAEDEAKLVMDSICDMLVCAKSWARHQGNDVDQDVIVIEKLSRSILSSSLVELCSAFDVGLAQRKFEACYPRLYRTTSLTETAEIDPLLQKCLNTALSLQYSFEKLLQERTTGSLMLISFFLSQSAATRPPSNSLLEAVFPVLAASLQSNTCIDASLAILLDILFPNGRDGPTSIDPDFIPPLSTVLVSLASTSPDPSKRHIAFRILAALLSQAPPLERVSLIRDLLAESPFPSMRVAAVGILKEAVLSVLTARSSPTSDPLASPALLQAFGYIILRPNPPDLFSSVPTRTTLQAFLETQEPKRLIECLAFYYVLLMRDKDNVTGVREPDQVSSVEKEFLSPLRRSLQVWAGIEDLQNIDEYARTSLAGLETGLERIEEARETLRLQPS